MVCGRCHHNNSDYASTCRHCGAPLNIVRPGVRSEETFYPGPSKSRETSNNAPMANRVIGTNDLIQERRFFRKFAVSVTLLAILVVICAALFSYSAFGKASAFTETAPPSEEPSPTVTVSVTVTPEPTLIPTTTPAPDDTN